MGNQSAEEEPKKKKSADVVRRSKHTDDTCSEACAYGCVLIVPRIVIFSLQFLFHAITDD